MTSAMNFSKDEMMVVCISRLIENDEVVVQGIATPMVAAAFLLAKKTHAPDLKFASAIGQGICQTPAPLSILNVEGLWLDKALSNIGFVKTACDILPSLRPKEFFRPAQIDKSGNFNNIAFGTNYKKPKLRLPGTGGIPDVTTFINKIYLYVPRHSKVTFVQKLDYLSGLGYHSERTKGSGPCAVVSDLGLFQFKNGEMILVSYHPGFSIEKIQRKTGFDLNISSNVFETSPPTINELNLLRNEIDPLGIRRLEMLSGSSRRKIIREIIQTEMSPNFHH
jgi:acyl CoA:acetate/3-ketoacid CoA transferase beta subunit